MSKKRKLSRKKFLSIGSYIIGGGISAMIGFPAVSYVISPAMKEEEVIDLIPLGLISKVEIGIPTLFNAKIQHTSGWIDSEQEVSFYVYSDNGKEFFALSNVCTHLGCSVSWVEEEDVFVCPCHNAVFTKKGEIVSGPPPRPLDRFKVVEKDGQLFVSGEKIW
jgi:menaquinol-cytochrome c reductase iron-sulfur subunit